MLYKNTLFKIKKSFGRYLSLFVIVLVGVGFYAGIQATAPDMYRLADQYYEEHHLADFKIVSSLGLTDEDVAALEALEPVNAAAGSYSLDVIGGNRPLRVHAVEKDFNTVTLIAGRMPENNAECLADGKNYAIGDVVTIDGDVSGSLRSNTFTVTGLIESVLYLSYDYGSTTVGDGKLSSFIFVEKECFTLGAYTEIYVAMDGLAGHSAYGSEYKALAKTLKDALVKIKPERENARYLEIYNEAEVRKNLPEIEHPKWTIFGREYAAGFAELEADIDVVASIAKVFPIFFILIAMLMTSNTMARMIAEERGELGTLTSLGFQDGQLIRTYLLYVLSASVLGAAAGYFIGCNTFPYLIYSNYDYHLPALSIWYDWIVFAAIMGITVLLMSVVTVAACMRELKEKPAALMRPLPPKRGQKILLERIGFIWKHLSFIWKITIRNMVRYKKRALMTVVGVAGCSALLLVGFGLRGSMDGIADTQYGEIFRYDNMMVLKSETQNLDGALMKIFEEEHIENPLLLLQSAVKCESGESDINAFLTVPGDAETFYKQYHLKSKISGADIRLDDRGVVITEKIADSFDLGRGDLIVLKDAENNERRLTVSDVAENYLSNYIYMSSALYAETFGQTALYNTVVSNFSGDEQQLASRLIDTGFVINITFVSDMIQTVLDGNARLNSIVVLLIAVASLLAIIVLYNLTSINISERKREIATLKVLGFRDGETNAYIYREAALLTIISIAVGLLLGVWLHRFIIVVIEGTARVLFKKISWQYFLISGLMTMAFSIIMQVVTYCKLRTINMVESLKSVE